MTDTSSPGVAARVPVQPSRVQEPTGWVGWIIFAAAMMIMVGVLHAIEGLVALFKDDYYLVTNRGLAVTVSYTSWGWAHLIGGLILALAGAALFTGRMWARVVAVAVAVISLFINFAFLNAYPLWSLIMIAIDVLVIYALTVHGREMRDF